MLLEYASCRRGTHAGTGTLVSLSGRRGAILGLMSAQPTMYMRYRKARKNPGNIAEA
jgi:hypothetical protein